MLLHEPGLFLEIPDSRAVVRSSGDVLVQGGPSTETPAAWNMDVGWICIYVHIYIYVCTHIHTYMYIYTYMYVHFCHLTYMYVYVYVFACACVYMYICILDMQATKHDRKDPRSGLC